MERGIDAVLAGRLGHFWEWTDSGVDRSGPPIVGWLRLSEDLIEVLGSALDEVADPIAGLILHQRPKAPLALLGVLEGETVLLMGVSSPGVTRRSGNQLMLDTVRYRAKFMISGIQRASDLLSPDLAGASVTFPGMLRWAGYESYTSESQTDERGYVQQSTINLLPLPRQSSGMIDVGKRIEMTTRWSYREDNEQPVVSTALEARVQASAPMPVHEIARMLQWVQLALTLAYRAWIPARPGFARPHSSDGGDWQPRPVFWASNLMTPWPSQGKTELIPFFTLHDLGHARGVARWIRLCEENRRVVDPLQSFHQNGSASVYDHINAMCSAIEYWAASRARLPGWGSIQGKPSGGLGKLHVVAHRAGRAWAQFVGDVDKWADVTWEAYLSSKHFRPGPTSSMEDLMHITASAEVLLTAALLDEAAGSKKVSRSMLSHGSLYGLGEHLRALTA